MKAQTSVKAAPKGTLVIRTGVKAGGRSYQHNQTRKLVIRTGVKAGGRSYQHNQSRA